MAGAPKARKCPNCNADIADTDKKCPVTTCSFNIERYDELLKNEDTSMLKVLIKNVLGETAPAPVPKKKGWFD